MTDELIARLADDLKPVRANTLIRWFAFAVVLGFAASVFLMVALFGPRHDLGQAAGTLSFWIKFGYTLGLGLLGVCAASTVARPGQSGTAPLSLVPIIVTMVAVTASIDFILAPPETRRVILMGSSALMCPFYILALSLPLLAAGMVFMRRMAPTNLTLAGACTGLMAGALGAWVYSFHCPEAGLPFLAIWYSLGIAASAIVGALLGKTLLRW